MGEQPMATVKSVHLFGFFEDDDTTRPRLATKAAPSPLTPWEHFERLRRHFAHWGDEVSACKTTRTLDGLFVAAEWVCPRRAGSDHCAPMWHMVMPPDAMWADFPDREQATNHPGDVLGDASEETR